MALYASLVAGGRSIATEVRYDSWKLLPDGQDRNIWRVQLRRAISGQHASHLRHCVLSIAVSQNADILFFCFWFRARCYLCAIIDSDYCLWQHTIPAGFLIIPWHCANVTWRSNARSNSFQVTSFLENPSSTEITVITGLARFFVRKICLHVYNDLQRLNHVISSAQEQMLCLTPDV